METTDEKIKAVKRWLIARGYSYIGRDNTWPEGTRLIVRRPRVAVFACEPEREQELFSAASQHYAATLFVREGETLEFVKEKLANCLNGKRLADLQKEEPRRRRVRITHYERVER